MYTYTRDYAYTHVTLSHLRSKESTGIHEPCIPILLHDQRADQRVQRKDFPGIHLDPSFELFYLPFDQ